MTSPVPTNLKLLSGNPGRRALNHAEPDPPYLQDLTPPPFLTSERAREVWAYLAPRAAEAKLLCELDVMTFARHCEDWAEYWVAQERVTQHFILGGSPVIGDDKAAWLPWIKLRDRAADRVEKGVAHFGLSPMARTRIRIQPQSDLFVNDFETFLRSLA